MSLRSLTLIAALVVVVAACSGPSASGSPDESPAAAATFAPGVKTSLFDLDEGDCFNSSEDPDAQDVALTDCGDAHEYEVYLVVDLDADASEPYPGTEAITAFVNEHCTERFAQFVGRAYEDSALWLYSSVPTEDSWASGDRTVRCSLYWPALDGAHQPLIGSAQGSNR